MFINWNERELHIKIVYYGPPLSGKTTNLEQLHNRLPPDRRTDLVSVKTREDRTLFFDFMQLELGQIKGLRPKFKLYTVPGQTYYEATRKLVLRDVDGLIFVADSSVNRLAANRQAIQDMWRQLDELEHDRNLPFVLQCNKQDLEDAVKPELLGRFLAVPDAPNFPAVATDGKGTAETLKHIVGQIIAKL
jgi:mutual gliding-motility protein MglA